MSGTKVLELVVFTLKDGVERADFLDTVGAVSDWLVRQPGFVSRDLAYDGEGDRWVETIWWADHESAEKSAVAAQTAEECAPMFALIEPDGMLFCHGVPAIETVTATATPAS
jgi:hypothetical protein